MTTSLNASWDACPTPILDGKEWSAWSWDDLTARCEEIDEQQIGAALLEGCGADTGTDRLDNDERAALRMFGYLSIMMSPDGATSKAVDKRRELHQEYRRQCKAITGEDFPYPVPLELRPLVHQIARIELEIGVVKYGSGSEGCWPADFVFAED